MDLKSKIRNVPDFPKQGIMFRDITTLLQDKNALTFIIDQLHAYYKEKNISKIVGIESRGFIIGTALAYRLGCGFVPIRKPGKLPFTTYREEYQLEYGTDAMEIHTDAIAPGEKVLIHDDLLATGGTISAACNLVKKMKGEIVGLSFIIELSFLQPRKKLHGYDILSLVQYDSE
ncbi:MAG: adenine phosphoribosyltransferase [Bacteroidota bacterium]|jgi:adenine phosphoribosyltransferase